MKLLYYYRCIKCKKYYVSSVSDLDEFCPSCPICFTKYIDDKILTKDEKLEKS